MTDKEIIKALECCISPECENCPYDGDDLLRPCNHNLMKDTLNLINRQQAEIKELEAEIDKQYEQAKADILGNMADGGASCHWCIDEHRKNAIKEFAERLKEKAEYFWEEKESFVPETDIDNLVEEMVGDAE